MTGYVLNLSNGNTLTTINVKTVDDQAHTSLTLIGQGIPDYGGPIAQDFVWLMENFAKESAPVNPLIGQEWFDLNFDRLAVFDGAKWNPLLMSTTSSGGKFDMLDQATNIDFTAVSVIPIFTGDSSRVYVPTTLILTPTGAYTATAGATVNVSIDSAGDVFPSTAIAISDASNAIVLRPSAAVSRMVIGGTTINLNITAAASGGQLNFDAHLFGFTI